jgi:hypothetical protein
VSGASGHPLLERVEDAGLVPLGWFRPGADDAVPRSNGASPAAVLLVGNAGPRMFARFAGERDPSVDSLDAWTRVTVDRLSADCGATALYPFDKPPLPFLSWARRAQCGHISPLGLNIHPEFGLWHAFRAALVRARPRLAGDDHRAEPVRQLPRQAVPVDLPGRRLHRPRLRCCSMRQASHGAGRR